VGGEDDFGFMPARTGRVVLRNREGRGSVHGREQRGRRSSNSREEEVAVEEEEGETNRNACVMDMACGEDLKRRKEEEKQESRKAPADLALREEIETTEKIEN
jgi:hypothetical protein